MQRERRHQVQIDAEAKGQHDRGQKRRENINETEAQVAQLREVRVVHRRLPPSGRGSSSRGAHDGRRRALRGELRREGRAETGQQIAILLARLDAAVDVVVAREHP